MILEKQIAIDAELHSDIERELLESGSNQEDLGGSISIRNWKVMTLSNLIR